MMCAGVLRRVPGMPAHPKLLDCLELTDLLMPQTCHGLLASMPDWQLASVATKWLTLKGHEKSRACGSAGLQTQWSEQEECTARDCMQPT